MIVPIFDDCFWALRSLTMDLKDGAEGGVEDGVEVGVNDGVDDGLSTLYDGQTESSPQNVGWGPSKVCIRPKGA
jgi:hypothetical protein